MTFGHSILLFFTLFYTPRHSKRCMLDGSPTCEEAMEQQCDSGGIPNLINHLKSHALFPSLVPAKRSVVVSIRQVTREVLACGPMTFVTVFGGIMRADRRVRFQLPNGSVVESDSGKISLERLSTEDSWPEVDPQALSGKYDWDYIRSIRQARALAASVMSDMGQRPDAYEKLIFVW